MNVKTGNEQGHHAGTVGILSGRPMISQPHPSSAYASTFSGPSIDQVAAAVLGRRTPFRSLEVGVSRQVTENEGTTLLYLSHRGPDAPNPPEYDPERLFDRLFGAAGRPAAARKAATPPRSGRAAASARVFSTWSQRTRAGWAGRWERPIAGAWNNIWTASATSSAG